MHNFQKIEFFSSSKYEDFDINFDVNEIYIDKSSIGKDDDEKQKYNFLAVARKNTVAKRIVVDLANNGFFLTEHSGGISLFKKFIDGESFLPNFLGKNTATWNNSFYSLEKAKHIGEMHRLLVIFSPVADFMYNASISRRMFFADIPDVKDSIPDNTHILRIADFGGVLGSAYLNTKFDDNIENKVQELIKKVQLDLLISSENTVFYGSGKGATGALYHGIKMKVKTLAVDPIISDEYFLDTCSDLHFIDGIMDKNKEEAFVELLEMVRNDDLKYINIITSNSSKQFEYISKYLIFINLNMNFYILNRQIEDKSSEMLSGYEKLSYIILNNLLYNIGVGNGLVKIY